MSNPPRMKMPAHIKVISFIFELVASRNTVYFLCFISLLSGYLIDCYFQTPRLFPAMGSMVSLFGLVLTIKNHYLKNISSIENLSEYEESQAECGLPVSDLGDDEFNVYVTSLIPKVEDEGIGLMLILLGTMLNVFGSYIPLVKLCLIP